MTPPTPRPRLPRQIPPEAAALFWARVTKLPNGCWTWADSIDQDRPPFRMAEDHDPRRVAWRLVKGIPVPYDFFDTCGNGPCVNPAHLRPANDADVRRLQRAKEDRASVRTYAMHLAHGKSVLEAYRLAFNPEPDMPEATMRHHARRYRHHPHFDRHFTIFLRDLELEGRVSRGELVALTKKNINAAFDGGDFKAVNKGIELIADMTGLGGKKRIDVVVHREASEIDAEIKALLASDPSLVQYLVPEDRKMIEGHVIDVTPKENSEPQESVLTDGIRSGIQNSHDTHSEEETGDHDDANQPSRPQEADYGGEAEG